MRWRFTRARTGFAVAVLVAAIAAVYFVFRGSSGDVEPEAGLVITRIQPAAELGDEITVHPHEIVEFRYELFNGTKDAIRGLKLGLACGCQATLPIPEEIPPGGAGTVGFRIQAANAGIMRRGVELHVAGELLTTLNVGLRAEFDPPAIVSPLDALRVTFVQRDDVSREVAIETIERRGTPPWIESLAVTPTGLLAVSAPVVDEAPGVDPELIARVYRFRLSCGTLAVGSHRGTLEARKHGGNDASNERIPLWIEVLDRVTVIPNPARVVASGTDKKATRVIVIRPVGQGTVEAASWDRELLSVRDLGAKGKQVAEFELAPRRIPIASRETKVVFRIDGKETRELTVRIDPHGAR